ncbi:mitochondrial carrier domain-containing protein [Polychytrium aggregatum]|uniref:mitochondrial carrier domain-containing protein n=1 Tax=Polychytrium aggregatum TaxID=110093 RepID=UPI0022FEEDFB|nr:mitochondrial carrier domain-containing protein [Polychytrium aggregatum]KAI9208878.1 mitochondrial carrier domain-containing protein [Polychytrium aggregatum]
MEKKPSTYQALLAGGIAGTAVDTCLFPLDTIKTRLQSKQGFAAAGGFRGVYSGLSSAVIGSAPSAALFFVSYEYVKSNLAARSANGQSNAATHMIAASCGEIMACSVRVPTEVVKQRMQTGQYHSVSNALRSILGTEGFFGFYRGYTMTIFREIPFTCIQFPLYEYFKRSWSHLQGRPTHTWEAALFGSVAGGIAAALTTPLDVVKTRIMLSSRSSSSHPPYTSIFPTFARIVREEGYRALFSGIGPRVTWISIGGCIFLGVYEAARKTLVDGKILA